MSSDTIGKDARGTYRPALNENELKRYRFMATLARQSEGNQWTAAGIVPGARVADIGCGPGAILVELAKIVAPGGSVDGVERDPDAVAAANQSIAEAGITQARVLVGDAEHTGLDAGSYDAVMIRHVLIHNPRPRAEAIVAHLCTLLRPNGRLFIVDTDLEASRSVPGDADLDDLTARYLELLRRDGNDVRIGASLGLLLLRAGLELEVFEGQFTILQKQARQGMRGPAWAARESLLAAGLATLEDVHRWDEAYIRDDADTAPDFRLIAVFRAVGRRTR